MFEVNYSRICMFTYHTVLINLKSLYLNREIARMLADDHMKRVVIVDTSNEIGGDGDVPHAGIGRARRMQVPNVNMQHNVRVELNSPALIAYIMSMWNNLEDSFPLILHL